MGGGGGQEDPVGDRGKRDQVRRTGEERPSYQQQSPHESTATQQPSPLQQQQTTQWLTQSHQCKCRPYTFKAAKATQLQRSPERRFPQYNQQCKRRQFVTQSS